MPTLAEVARYNGRSLTEFNRRTLIPDLLSERETCDLARPSDNYVVATKMVWQALKSQALKQDPTGQNNAELNPRSGRAGRTVRGMGTYQAIELLWPHLSDRAIPRAGAAIRKYLKRGGNAECKNQNRAHQIAVWWVADDYVDIQLSRTPPKPKPIEPVTAKPTEVEPVPPKSIKPKPTEVDSLVINTNGHGREFVIFEAPVILGTLRQAREIATEPIEIAVLDHAITILTTHYESQADTRQELSHLRSTVDNMRALLT